MKDAKFYIEDGGAFGEHTAVIHSLGTLNWKIYDCITTKHTTNEVIITEEQVIHIRERHPEAYSDILVYIKDILSDPDYIFRDKRPNTGLVVKKMVNGENSLLVLKIMTPEDQKEYKNSVITSWKITEKRLNNYLRNKDVIYKKE